MKNLFIGFLIIFSTILLDQLSKWWVLDYLNTQDIDHLYIFSFFSLVKVFNSGISFGLFNSLPHSQVVFSAIASLIVFILLIWLKRSSQKYEVVSLGLIIGGAIGNIIDRLLVGAVIDFLDFHIKGYHWPAFNIADSAVFIGVVVLLFGSFFIKPQGD